MKNTIIFDMDGTLLNTLEDLKDSVNYALETFSFPTRSLNEIRDFVGNGVECLLARSVPEGTPDEVTEECLKCFTEHYKGNMRNKTAPYEGILPLLQELKEKGYKTAIVSNKIQHAVQALSDELFTDLITVAIGDSPKLKRKPAPDMVFEALRILQSSKEDSVYVGDSDVDMETAQNSGLVSIGVTWGFRDEDVLKATGADYIVNHPSEIADLMGKIN